MSPDRVHTKLDREAWCAASPRFRGLSAGTWSVFWLRFLVPTRLLRDLQVPNGILWSALPVTAAGPRRYLTGLPITRCGSFSGAEAS